MKILIVAYHFPPDAEIGAVRPAQMAKYLPEFGIEPWVLTVAPEFAERPSPDVVAEGIREERIRRTVVRPSLSDHFFAGWRRLRRMQGRTDGGGDMVSEPPPEDRLDWTKRLRGALLSWLQFPDPRAGWYRPAVDAGDALCAAVGFDAIVSTSPPRVAHLVGARLARRHRIPWLMDLRDPWYYRQWGRVEGGRLLEAAYDRLFRRCAGAAALMTANTEPLRAFSEGVLGETSPPSLTIPNGCLGEGGPAEDTPVPGEFLIGHYGQFMGKRTPDSFLAGLRLWLGKPSRAPRELRVRFVGSGLERVQSRAKTDGLLPFVECRPNAPRSDVPRLMSEDYVLLLIANDQPLQIPGKAYEYLGACRRILAVTEPASATAQLLSGRTACRIAGEPAGVAQALEDFWTEFSAGQSRFVDRRAELAELQYRRRIEEFATALRRMAP